MVMDYETGDASCADDETGAGHGSDDGSSKTMNHAR